MVSANTHTHTSTVTSTCAHTFFLSFFFLVLKTQLDYSGPRRLSQTVSHEGTGTRSDYLANRADQKIEGPLCMEIEN